jgi:hypothetical protein
MHISGLRLVRHPFRPLWPHDNRDPDPGDAGDLLVAAQEGSFERGLYGSGTEFTKHSFASIIKVRFHDHIFATNLMTNSLAKLP